MLPAPPYEKLQQDGTLSGVVIAGANISSRQQILDYYKWYFSQMGFQFGAPSSSVATVDFLLQNVANNRYDFLIKEAHSDGDEKNLLRVYTRSQIVSGSRKNPDGSRSLVDLVYPDSNSGTRLNPNSDFAAAVRRRPQGVPLVYFNTS